MLYAVAIDAQNASSGKPRRGFLVYAATGELRGFADDRYRGSAALWAVENATGETVTELCSLRVTPAEYREARRQPVQF